MSMYSFIIGYLIAASIYDISKFLFCALYKDKKPKLTTINKRETKFDKDNYLKKITDFYVVIGVSEDCLNKLFE